MTVTSKNENIEDDCVICFEFDDGIEFYAGVEVGNAEIVCHIKYAGCYSANLLDVDDVKSLIERFEYYYKTKLSTQYKYYGSYRIKVIKIERIIRRIGEVYL